VTPGWVETRFFMGSNENKKHNDYLPLTAKSQNFTPRLTQYSTMTGSIVKHLSTGF
jgi:hypothetical protein